MKYKRLILLLLVWPLVLLMGAHKPPKAITLELPVTNALLDSYSSKYWEIYCYDMGKIIFKDWSETDLTMYSDRLEYFSVTKNTVVSIYNATICKAIPPRV